jgi:hypothetical protein
MSIKKGISYNSPVWAGDSFFHQSYVFPAHITQCLIPRSPMSMLVKE